MDILFLETLIDTLLEENPDAEIIDYLKAKEKIERIELFISTKYEEG